MLYMVIPLDPGKKWKITSDNQEIGIVDRLATGYLVSLTDPPKKVKRYRMIDALHETLGEDSEIQVLEG